MLFALSLFIRFRLDITFDLTVLLKLDDDFLFAYTVTSTLRTLRVLLYDFEYSLVVVRSVCM